MLGSIKSNVFALITERAIRRDLCDSTRNIREWRMQLAAVLELQSLNVLHEHGLATAASAEDDGGDSSRG
jgi:hypothetical protein